MAVTLRRVTLTHRGVTAIGIPFPLDLRKIDHV